MRLKFIYACEAEILPLDYRNYFMKLIKDALSLTDLGKEYLEKFYYYDEDTKDRANKVLKPFCFAVRF